MTSEHKYIALPNTWFDAGTEAELVCMVGETAALFCGMRLGKPDEEISHMDEFFPGDM